MGLALPRQQVEGLLDDPRKPRGACIIRGKGAQHGGSPNCRKIGLCGAHLAIVSTRGASGRERARGWFCDRGGTHMATAQIGRQQAPRCRLSGLRRTPAAIRFVSFEPLLEPISNPDLTGIHWAIVGGESGPGARPVKGEWMESLRDSCVRQRVAFFFKQGGGRRKKATGRTLGDRTWDDYPSNVGATP